MQNFDHACFCTTVFCYIEYIILRSMTLSFEDNTVGSCPWLLVACMPHVVLSPVVCIFCWILFSIAAWCFAISFLLLKCSHCNYVPFPPPPFFPGVFSPFNSFTYASFCFLYAAGMCRHCFVTRWRPSWLLGRAFLSLTGNICHRNDGHVSLTRNQGTKSTETHYEKNSFLLA